MPLPLDFKMLPLASAPDSLSSSHMHAAILDSFTTDHSSDCWAGIRSQVAGLTVHPRTRSDEIVARAAGCRILLINKAMLTAEHLAALPDLRYVGVMATGTNVVDLAVAQARGVAVSNVPGYSTMSVAQLVWSLVLHLTHDVAGHDAEVQAGGWAASPDFCFFRQPLIELAGKTLVVVGMGTIGRATARIGEAFGMRVIAAAAPGSATADRMPLADALPLADVIALHCPLTPATHSLVGRDFLAALKPGAIVVNTGRGSLIDYRALMESLANGRLGGAALDVLAVEPPPADDPLLAALASRPAWARRVVITPHIAWGTVEARARLVAEVERNLAAFLHGEKRNRVA